LSQGLFYGLRYFLTGVLLLLSPEGTTGPEAWGTVQGMILLQVAQFLGLFAGGVLAGGGMENGMLAGLLVGVFNGILAATLLQNASTQFSVVSVYGMPMLHATVGAMGGGLGCGIWKPIPSVQIPGLSPGRKVPRKPQPSPFAGKVAWGRVMLGTGLAVGGYLSAGLLLDKIVDLSAGYLGTSDPVQDRIITWEIKALAMLLGGVLAGASSENGLKQGLVVGMLSSMCLIIWDSRLTTRWLEVALLNMISAFCLALVGGWFGGTLLPRVVRMPRSRRFGMLS
jgi:hypothetical protein